MVLAGNHSRFAMAPLRCQLDGLDRAMITASCWSFDHPLERDLEPQIVLLNSVKCEGLGLVSMPCPRASAGRGCGTAGPIGQPQTAAAAGCGG